MPEKIRKDVLEIVAMVTEKDIDQIALDAHLIQDLGADSMMALEILAALEKKYRIVIPEEKLRDMTTVNRITNLVATCQKRK